MSTTAPLQPFSTTRDYLSLRHKACDCHTRSQLHLREAEDLLEAMRTRGSTADHLKWASRVRQLKNFVRSERQTVRDLSGLVRVMRAESGYPDSPVRNFAPQHAGISSIYLRMLDLVAAAAEFKP